MNFSVLKKNYLLILFFLLIIFLYCGLYFLVYFFLIPLFLYLFLNENINLFLFSLGLLLFSLVFSYNFKGYGLDFLFITIIVNFLFYFTFIIFLKKLIKNKYFYLLIPSFFYILFYLFKFTIYNNFWINYSGFLLNKTFLMPIFGSYILTVFIIFFNLIFSYLIYQFLVYFKKRKINYNNIKLFFLNNKKYFFIFFLFLFVFLFPNSFFKNYDNFKNVEVLAIQPNLNQSFVDRIINSEKNFDYMLYLTNKGLEKYNNSKVIIWPEYIFPIDFTYVNSDYLNILKEYSFKKNISLIFGSLSNINNSEEKYDTLYLISNNKVYKYFAREPVRVFSNKTKKYFGDYNKISIDNINFGLILCYEENFPYLFRDQINNLDSNIFIIIGNQYHIKNKNALKLTSFNSNLRAAENNRFIVRLENTGLSKIIDNNGKTVYTIEPNKEGYLYYEVPLIDKKSFYSRYGDFLEIFLFILSFIFFLFFLF
jgi:apolipoprotein N-acyltransferase